MLKLFQHGPTKIRKKMSRKKIRQRRLMIVFGIPSTILLIYIVGVIFYWGHFYNNTTINGLNCSNMSAKSAEAAITKEVRNYKLELKERNKQSEEIKGSDFDFETVFDGSLSQLKKEQNPFLWVGGLFHGSDLEIQTMLTYSEEKLQTVLDNLTCTDEANAKQPVNASVSAFNGTGYEIVPEDEGAFVEEAKLFEVVKSSVENLKSSISLEDEGCYVAPTITSTNEALVNAVATLNLYTKTDITYDFEVKTEEVTGEMVSEWVSVDDQFNVSLNSDKVAEFVEYIRKTYNTYGKTRSLKTSYGQTINVSGGDYGWWLDENQELEDLIALIKEGSVSNREPAYRSEAASHQEDDVGDTYIELNLTAQHLFYYKDGALVIESDFVSGNLSKNLGTKTGIYAIMYKDRNATLVGEDYETPVSYWMPFYENVGLHDATWRTEFGGDIYKTNGSHGCINLPADVAKTIYESMEKGTAVFSYELPGTESTKDAGTTADTTTQTSQ